MSTPPKIQELIEKFRSHLQAYHSGRYSETQVRNEFINPFFEVLGWDIQNKEGQTETLRDVIHEDALHTGGTTRAPDYSFCVGGTRLFFVEAKRPAVDLKNNIHPAFQLRRYGWSAKLDVSILTDFEELAVYDCRKKPKKNDKPHIARILYVPYTEYTERWHEISDVFSKEAVMKGAISQFIDPEKGKSGDEVDNSLLREIELWREKLARHMALRNAHLNENDLNLAVLKTINRILFLRICEDRGIEDGPNLYMLLNGNTVYARLCDMFRKADQHYNSGLFHFHADEDRFDKPDTFTLHLEIDDEILKGIIRRLYYPDCSYEFSVLPSNILAQVMTKFLGKTAHVTKMHRVKIEERPEIKRAGGIYAIPTHMVNYIVQNTLGRILRGKTPADIGIETASPLRLLDPACGSGDFLLASYQTLLDWYLEWYTSDDPEKWAKHMSPKLYRAINGEWRLTLPERKMILQHHLFGVDIDRRAIEVTRFSLLLKILEGENQQTLTRQMKLFKQKALPDLSRNIKCGNSLVGSDFYKEKSSDLLTREQRMTINVFDWENEFQEIKKTGGFDVVIGNPPSFECNNHNLETNIQNYFKKKYSTYQDDISNFLFQFFIERALLFKPQSLSFVVPVTCFMSAECVDLRHHMIFHMNLDKLAVSKRYWPPYHVPLAVFVLSRSSQRNKKSLEKVNQNGTILLLKEMEINQSSTLWDISSQSESLKLLVKMEQNSIPVKDLADLTKGLVVKNIKSLLKEYPENHDLPYLLGNSIQRYETAKRYYLNLQILSQSSSFPGKGIISETPKLFIRRIGRKLVASHSSSKEIVDDSLYMLFSGKVDLYYFLGLLNSKLMSYYFKKRIVKHSQKHPQILMSQLNRLPIRDRSDSDGDEKLIHDKLIKFVKIIIALKKQKPAMQTKQERDVLQRQIDETDRQIDLIVYELYDLRDEEIQIVEEHSD